MKTMSITSKAAESSDSFISIGFSPKNELEAMALILMVLFFLAIPVIAYFWGRTDGKESILNKIDDFELKRKLRGPTFKTMVDSFRDLKVSRSKKANNF